MELAEDTILQFDQITGYNALNLFSMFNAYMTTQYQQLVDFYTGKEEILPVDAMTALSNLDNEVGKLEDNLVTTYFHIDRLDFFDYIQALEDIATQIKVHKRLGKFLRSAKYVNGHENSVAIDYNMADGDTLEKVSAKRSLDPQNDWHDIAVRNNLLETDYSVTVGGTLLHLGKRQARNLFLLSVCDYLIGEKVHGLDIAPAFVFADNDLHVLSYRDTFKTSANILANLQAGDVPEYATLGRQHNILGSNIGALIVPFIARQVREVFSVDDTKANFVITDVTIKGAKMFVSFSVNSFYNLIYNDQIVL